jgi:Tfp pilus assembly protein PilX
MRTMIQSLRARRNQAGMASILVTLVTLIIISLIVLGFATVSRREQSNTLDQQLSTQAFYGAETAVNDARQVIDADAATLNVPAKNDCTTNTVPGAGYPTGVQWLNAGDSVGYTCLLVDPTPSVLQYNGIGTDSKVIPVTANAPFNKIQIQWTPDASFAGNPLTGCPGSTNHTFSPSSKWSAACGFGVMRVDVEPTTLNTGQVMTQNSLETNLFTTFFEPQKSGGSGQVTYATGSKPQIQGASCTATAPAPVNGPLCTAVINLGAQCPGGSGAWTCTGFTLRLNSLYMTSGTVTVTALNGGNVVPTNGQVLVDATGIASGVLRRIQVRISVISYNGLVPDFAIQSNGGICKRYAVTPDFFSIDSSIVSPDYPNDAMCNAGYNSGTAPEPSP